MRQVIKIEVASQVQWQVGRAPSGRFIAVCDPLGLTMEGSGLDDLAANINDATQLLMVDLLSSGELDSFLRSRGWHATNLPAEPETEDVEFDVPIPLLVRQGRDSARAFLQ
jgi:hypothetical protein